MNRRLSETFFLVLVTVGSVFPLIHCGAPKPILSSRKLIDLLKNAKTPDDHLKLAAHFRAEAEEFEVQARHHEELAAYYRAPSWQIRGAVATAHCERVGTATREAADEARALAAMHEGFAKELSSGKQ